MSLKEAEEMARLNQSQSMKLANVYFKLKRNNDKNRKIQEIKEKIEREKRKKELEKTEENSKRVIIENINNFYSDRIKILKDKIKEEKICSEILRADQKKQLSDLRKEKKKKTRNNDIITYHF